MKTCTIDTKRERKTQGTSEWIQGFCTDFKKWLVANLILRGCGFNLKEFIGCKINKEQKVTHEDLKVRVFP